MGDTGSTMTLTRGVNTIEVNTPQFGYNTEILIAMHRSPRLSNGAFHWQDNGIAYDNRICKCTLLLNSTQQKNLQDFFNTDTKGRGNEFQLKVPKGFFPFGADKGSPRRYRVRLLNSNFRGASASPWLNFETELTFALIYDSNYTIPSETHVIKPLQIGTVHGLRYPKEWYDPTTSHGVSTTLMHGQRARTIDKSDASDYYDTNFKVAEKENLTANLIYYLQNTARGSVFGIAVQKKSFIFGRDKCDTGANEGGGLYDVTLANNVINIIHERKDSFMIDISLSYRSYTSL